MVQCFCENIIIKQENLKMDVQDLREAEQMTSHLVFKLLLLKNRDYEDNYLTVDQWEIHK